VNVHLQPLAPGVANQPGTQLFGVQPHVLGDPVRDGQPHRVRGEHQRSVLGKGPADGAQ
jgi:hypothetical protein